MSIGYGLVRGLTKGLIGAERGQLEGEQAKRQQAIADEERKQRQALIQAQILNYQSEAANRSKPKPRMAHYNPKTGEVIYTTEEGPATSEKAGTPDPQPFERPIPVPAGATLVNPRTGATVAQGAPKPLSVTERETNAAARTALDLVRQMKQAHGAKGDNSQLPLAASALRGVGRMPIVGDLVSGITEPAAQSFMTPAQADYQQKADQLLHLASSVLPKGGRSMALLKNLRSSFTSSANAANPESAQQALNELEGQLNEVLAGAPGVPSSIRAPMAGLRESPATAGKDINTSDPHAQFRSRR